MSVVPIGQDAGGGHATIDTLRTLRRDALADDQFWARYLNGVAALCRADAALILTEGEGGAWQPMAGVAPLLRGHDAGVLAAAASGQLPRALSHGYAVEKLRGGDGAVGQSILLLARLPWLPRPAVLALVVEARSQQKVNEAVVRTLLVADIPGLRANPVAAEAETVPHLVQVMDIMAVTQSKDRFIASCMTVVNMIAANFGCSQASIGWAKGNAIRVHAISGLERFEERTSTVMELQAAYDEAADQDAEIQWPPPPSEGLITAAHHRAARIWGVDHIFTLPLRRDGQVVGVLCCEWVGEEPDIDSLRALRLLASQITPWLALLEATDLWAGARVLRRLDGWRRQFIKPEHVGAKSLGVMAALLLSFLLIGRWDYRVDGTAQLATDHMAILSAPFDGFVESVPVRAGDPVKEGQDLVKLDTRDMQARELETLADLRRQTREGEKARASGDLAEMRIAEANEQKVRTQLERVRYYLSQATIRSPFDGVVVDGDQKRLAGAPVSKGEAVMRVVQVRDIYLEIRISERDFQDVKVGDQGELSLLTRPDEKITFTIERVLPVAQVEPGQGNIFIVQAKFPEDARDWWRPGMSGIAKIQAGRRSILWILTHRTLDALRLSLWW
jgi:RND family efflux transporter MFP subunit